jgi:uncharacterized membrane protein YuzA (DUF378 family)
MEHVDRTTANSRRSTLGTLAVIALVLLIIGGLNWALVGLFEFDLVAALLGEMSVFSRIVYVLVGISAIICIADFKRLTRAA